MVAMICPGKQGTDNRLFHNQYINPTDGKWTTDFDHKATCRQDKVEILEYCKKVYPDQDINNIVESNHYVKINNWCKLGRTKCKGPSRWVKPFRCLAGPFQSDALLVPEHCLFDHIHNQTRCWDFDMWNRTAGGACVDRGMKVKSFAMLLPCGIDVFSGVEFVCCPKKVEKVKKERILGGSEHDSKPLTSSWPNELKLQEIENDNEDKDTEDDERR
jgi:amyloid beta A4 protein